jgi:IclR family pca regulon transcriptional regulator
MYVNRDMADASLQEQPNEQQSGDDYVSALARGLEVIRVFTRSEPSLTLSEVAERTDMHRAAARRILLTLVREGYAATDGKHFRLRPKILELGFSALSSLDICEVAQPVLNELAEKLQESCFAAVLDGDTTVYVARASARRVINVGINVGHRAPAYAGSTGRVLLSGLSERELDAYIAAVKLEKFTPHTVTSKVKLRDIIDETRRQGWSIVNEELELGLRSISVPIRDRSGDVSGALNVCCPSARVTPEDMRTRILSELLESAQRISHALPE